MDKRKLVNIILKDLEEVRILSEEVADSQEDSLIEIELALNRAKLLIQEIELLRELAGGHSAVHYTTDQKESDMEEEAKDETEDDEQAMVYPEPELEIINYEEGEFPGNDDPMEEEQEDFIGEDQEEVNEEKEEPTEEVTLEIDEEMEEEDLNTDEDDLDDEEWEEDELEEEEDGIEEEDEKSVEPAFEQVKPMTDSKIQSTELKSGPQAGIREIHIDDMDDEDDIQPVRIAPLSPNNTRPPMREIPKPEDVIIENPEKMSVDEKFHKEKTLNETLGENKAVDSRIPQGAITSLKAAIGLNDRFLFIREIFNNNSAKYNEVIDRLDTMNQIQEAVEYLKANLSMEKNEASMKFVELLKRRFTK